MADDKYNILVDAKITADAKIKNLTKRLADLGGPEMVKANRTVNKLEREINLLSGTAKKGPKIFTKFTNGIAIGNIAAEAAMGLMRGLKNAILGTLEAAANTQAQWTMVTAALERHGLATENNITVVKQFASQMQTLTGVADEEWGRAVQTMVDRGASLSQAFDLVGATADVAASKNKDMSRVLNEMADIIGRKDLLVLEKYGVEVDKNAGFTTQLDQAISQLNKNFGGAAADKADTYAVKMAVVGQTFGDLQEKIGLLVLPVLTELGSLATEVIEELMRIIDVQFPQTEAEGFTGSVKDMRAQFRGLSDDVRPVVVAMVSGIQIIWNALWTLMTPARLIGEAIIGLGKGFLALVSGDFRKAAEALPAIWEGWGDVLGESKQDFWDLIAAAQNLGAAFTGDLGEVARENLALTTATVTDMVDTVASIPPAVFYGDDSLSDDELNMAEIDAAIRKTVRTTRAVTTVQKQAFKQLGASMQYSMNGAIGSIVNGLGFLRTESNGIFKQLAADFMREFVNRILSAVANILIPRLLSLLASIFDTPANDRMAAQQGADFGRYFMAGALGVMDYANLGNAFAVTAGGGLGGGTTVNQSLSLQFHGPVTSAEFVEREIVPQVEAAARRRASSLVIDDTELSGGRYVR